MNVSIFIFIVFVISTFLLFVIQSYFIIDVINNNLKNNYHVRENDIKQIQLNDIEPKQFFPPVPKQPEELYTPSDNGIGEFKSL